MRTATKHTKEAITPSTIAAQGATCPAAGVIATRPATTPDASPRLVALPWWNHSIASHARPPAAAAVCVVVNARPAVKPATGNSTATAEPALKPNQPNHKRPAPSSVIVRLCGRIA